MTKYDTAIVALCHYPEESDEADAFETRLYDFVREFVCADAHLIYYSGEWSSRDESATQFWRVVRYAIEKASTFTGGPVHVIRTQPALARMNTLRNTLARSNPDIRLTTRVCGRSTYPKSPRRPVRRGRRRGKVVIMRPEDADTKALVEGQRYARSHRAPYGTAWNKDGPIKVLTLGLTVKVEAVRFVFSASESGWSSTKIAKALTARGSPPPTKGGTFSRAWVGGVLRNRSYVNAGVLSARRFNRSRAAVDKRRKK